MTWKNLRRWMPWMVMVACHGSLTVDEKNPGGGAVGSAGGTVGSVGGAGSDGGSQVGRDAEVQSDSGGKLGARCVLGSSTIEAQGTVARAEVVTLDRCDDGLTCGPDAICIPVPDCPSTASICLVRRALPPRDGGDGGGGAGEALKRGRGTH